MKKFLFIAVIGLALYGFFEKNPDFLQFYSAQSISSEQLIKSAYENRQSNLQVGGSGTVISILPDDTQGSRHQKFIIRLSTGQTLLMAHNIDLAPRIKTLREGDTVEFYGEYDWSSKGGIVHWTHRDQGGYHENGFLKHKGFTYN